MRSAYSSATAAFTAVAHNEVIAREADTRGQLPVTDGPPGPDGAAQFEQSRLATQCDANSSQLLQLDILGGDILGGDASTRAQPAELHPDSTIAAACARASPDTAAPCSSVTTQQHEDNMLLSFDMLGGDASASRAPQPVQLVALHPETPIAADYTRLSPDAANASNCVTTLQVAGSMLPHLDMLDAAVTMRPKVPP